MSLLLEFPGIQNRARPLSVAAWHMMIAQGLAPKRAELLEGVIVEKMSKSILHTRLLSRTMKAFYECLTPDFWLRQESPITTKDSEPEPDISLVQGSEDSHDVNPTTALLVVEISVSTVAEDRAMARIYAAANVAEYWLFNAPGQQVEIFCKPIHGSYTELTTVPAHGVLTSSAVPHLHIDLAALWSGLPL